MPVRNGEISPEEDREFERQVGEGWRQDVLTLMQQVEALDGFVGRSAYGYILEKLIHLMNELPEAKSLAQQTLLIELLKRVGHMDAGPGRYLMINSNMPVTVNDKHYPTDFLISVHNIPPKDTVVPVLQVAVYCCSPERPSYGALKNDRGLQAAGVTVMRFTESECQVDAFSCADQTRQCVRTLLNRLEQ